VGARGQLVDPSEPTVGQLVAAGVAALATVCDTPRLDAELLLAAAAGSGRSAVIAFPERGVPPSAAESFQAALARRALGEPLAYILGCKEFFSLTLAVTPAVLVPRPETELLVEELLARVPRGPCTVLDLGTGSGALALAIKHKRPELAVTGVDASAAALGVARLNGERLGLDVAWQQSDWYAELAGERYDAVVCNPPYLRSDDPALATALRFEPRSALDGGGDGLDAFRHLLAASPAHLKPGGLLLLEHGADQQAALRALAERHGFRVLAAGSDLAGRPRTLALEAPEA
jgi:release factor glutamine methyltransferase